MYTYKGLEYQAIASWVKPFNGNPTFQGRQNRTYNSSLIKQVKNKITSWSNICIAGGAVLNHVKGYKADDIDFYIVGCTDETHYGEVAKLLVKTFDKVTRLTDFSVSGLLNGVKVQLILDHATSVDQIVGAYDIPVCKMAYQVINGEEHITCTKDFIEGFITKVIVIDPYHVSGAYDTRLFKYYLKGFDIHLPEISKLDKDQYKPEYLHDTDLRSASPRRLFKRIYMGKEASDLTTNKDYVDYDNDPDTPLDEFKKLIISKKEEKERALMQTVDRINWNIFYYRTPTTLTYLTKKHTNAGCYMGWGALLNYQTTGLVDSIPEFDNILKYTKMEQFLREDH